MIRSLFLFALSSSRPGDVVFKLAVFVVLLPVIGVIACADFVERRLR